MIRFLLLASLFALSAVGCTPPRETALTGAPDGKDKAYGPLPRQVLDYYVAEAPGTPIVLFVHGGGWVCCSKDDDDNLQVARVFHDAGYAVVSMDYTLAEDAEYEGFPHQLREVAMGLAWAKEHADLLNGDPERVVLVGESAGAHLVGLLGVYNPRSLLAGSPYAGTPHSLDVRAVVGWSGIYSIAPDHPAVAVGEVYGLMLGTDDPKTYEERLHASQPIHHLDGSTRPAIAVLHGQQDDVVGYANSVSFYDALVDSGYCAELTLLPENGHDFIEQAAPDNPVFVPTLDFIARATGDVPLCAGE